MGWKRTKTNAIARWNNGTTVVLIQKVREGYEAIYSYATGGWQSIKLTKSKAQAFKSARSYMKSHPEG